MNICFRKAKSIRKFSWVEKYCKMTFSIRSTADQSQNTFEHTECIDSKSVLWKFSSKYNRYNRYRYITNIINVRFVENFPSEAKQFNRIVFICVQHSTAHGIMDMLILYIFHLIYIYLYICVCVCVSITNVFVFCMCMSSLYLCVIKSIQNRAPFVVTESLK